MESNLGCEHYQRPVQIKASCCGKWFTCRVCHDESVMTHKIDRFATKTIRCLGCQMEQDVSEKCVNPVCQYHEGFCKYVCLVCKFFENSDRDLYHCDQCGICRAGKRDEYTHCDDCGVCLANSLYNDHQCTENYDGRCVVCLENLFNSRSPVIRLPACGHLICTSCHNEYIMNDYKCPHCGKSMGDMTRTWLTIDMMAANMKMPEVYDNSKSNITCNDCNQKSTVPYHFQFHKCSHCGGYNTDILTTENMPTQEQMRAYQESQRQLESREMTFEMTLDDVDSSDSDDPNESQ